MSDVAPVLVVVLFLIYWSGRTQAGVADASQMAKRRSPSKAVARASFPAWTWTPRRSRSRKKGSIFLGMLRLRRKYLPRTDSLLVLGPTRSGKTLRLALPVLEEFDGPAVVTSVKRDLFQLSIAARRKKGNCFFFDLDDPTSASWNIFSLIWDFRSAKVVSDSLCAVTKSKTAEIDFWGRLSSKMLAPLLLAGKMANSTLSDVFGWIESQQFDPAFDMLSEGGHIEARAALDAVLSLDQRAVSSVIATLLSLLEPYSDPIVSSLLSRDGIELERIVDRKAAGTLYLCAPLFRAERFFGVYELFLDKVFELAYEGGTGEQRMLFLLDELANIAPVSSLDRIASTCGGYGIVLVSIFQDMTQLNSVYGVKSGTVINNHRSKLCLAGVSDATTLDYVEKLSLALSDQESTRNPLALLRSGTALLLEANAWPQKLRLRPFPGHRRNDRC